MRNTRLIIIALLLCSCTTNNIEIAGTIHNENAGIISIIDPVGNTLFSTVIKGGKFTMKQQPLPDKGYYTLSVQTGSYPRDFDIYLERGKYAIEVPENERQYLKVQSESVTQQDLSAYYDMENGLSEKLKEENAVWIAKLKDPKSDQLTEAEFKTIMERVEAGRRREYGIHIAALDMFIKKYPKSLIVPHIISNMDYKADPETYYMLYNKLSTEAKNSDEGKLIGNKLQELVKK